MVVDYEMLAYRSVETIGVKCEFFLDELCLEVSTLCKMVAKFPPLLGLSIEENIKPRMKFFADELGLGTRTFGKMVAKFPPLLALSIENIKRKV